MQDIKDYLSYDPETGLFTRLKDTCNCKAGSIAGTKHHAGYIQVSFKNKKLSGHRLAWWYVHGYIPDVQIDHINEIKDDNRICNLRLDVNRENEQNVSTPMSTNTSGFKGVCWNIGMRKWHAQLNVKGKRVLSKYYNTPEEAYEAYLCAKRKYHPFWVENKVA